MKQDEILEMARQTGVLAGYEGEPSLLVIFSKAIMDVERESCAKVCEDSVEYAGNELARQIRARGEA